MEVISTNILGVLLIKPKVFEDHRGYFYESYSQHHFTKHGLSFEFVQDNEAFSRQSGIVRGLHFQAPPMAQTKVVRVLRGAVFDVVVDLRRNSPTFGKWQGFTLSAENKMQLVVPKGMAHGYMTTAPNTVFFYKVDAFYSPAHDGGILWNDPDLGIKWPNLEPILSDKDTRMPLLRDFSSPFFAEAPL